MRDEDLERAVAYNRARGYSRATVERIQREVGAPVDGLWGPHTTLMVMRWQTERGLDADGMVGPKTLARMSAPWRETRVLTSEECDRVISFTVAHEAAGAANPYAATNLDAEYEGWFDKPRSIDGQRLHPRERARRPEHRPFWASRYGSTPTHIGVSLGPWQAAQDPGTVGLVMRRWYELAPDEMAHVCGSDDVARELIAITCAGGERELRIEGDGGRRRRCVLPVAGHDLWRGPWPERWARAAELPGYRRAHRDVIRDEYLTHAWALSRELGWTTQADLAVLFDLMIQMGPGWVRKHARRVAGPDVRAVLPLLSADHRRRREEILGRAASWVTYEGVR